MFEYGEEAFQELVWQVRLLVFESAAKHKLPGLVFTWDYSHSDLKPLLDRLLSTLAPYDVEVHHAHVHCSQTSLEDRVQQSDRKAADKIHTVEALHRQQALKHHAIITGTDSLDIDNTNLSPDAAVETITAAFFLPRPDVK